MSGNRFFVPFLDEGAETNNWYTVAKSILGKQYGLTNERIYSFTSTHNGVKFTDTVGQKNAQTKKTILAIFEGDDFFITLVEGSALTPMLASRSSEPWYFDEDTSK